MASESYWLGKVNQVESGKGMVKLVKSSFHHEAETKQALVDFILETDRLSMGEQCLMFEKTFAAKQDREYAVFVSSGSMANLLLIQALLNLGRLKKGDRVGFSALTWPTNVMPLIQLGLIPVPLDCNPETLNVSPKVLRQKAWGLQALFLTNVLGFCDDLLEIREICNEHDILFLEDNCESLGSKVGEVLLGNFGEASTFSFFVGHHMSTIEGGMICTNDKELNQALIMARAHGWDRNLSPAEQKKFRNQYNIDEFYSRYAFYDLAYNARPTEINGFLGNQQIQYLDEIVEKRVENFGQFLEALQKNDDFLSYDLSHMSVVSNFAMPVVCHDEKTSIIYKEKFLNNGIEIRPIIAGNITKQPFYRKYAVENDKCPVSYSVHTNGFYFGNNPEMTTSEISKITKLLKK